MTAINPIEELLWDPEVSEIMVDAPDSVWVERRGEIAPAGVQFLDEEHVLSTIELMVSSDGCRYDIRYDSRGPQRYDYRLYREGAPFDGRHVNARRDDTDGHWKLNIRKCGNDVPVDMPHEHIGCGCSVESMADHYRALDAALMGFDSEAFANMRKAELRMHECYRNRLLALPRKQ